MDYATLKSEIALPAYAGMTDAEISAALNAPIACTQDVPARSVRAVLMARGKWPLVLIASEATTKDATWAAARLLYDFVGEGGTFDTSNGAMLAALTGQMQTLVAGSVLVDADKAAVLALTEGTTTRAAQLGLGSVNAGDIQTARIA
jgi:hypothetical protein